MIDALFEVARVGADQDGLRRWLDRVGWGFAPDNSHPATYKLVQCIFKC